jgi:two-component system, NarL family, response regulator LiaR
VKAAEVLEAIRRAARGEATLHPKIAARVIKTFRDVENEDVPPFTALTEREVEILKLIANGYSNEKIAEQLVISVGTVKGHDGDFDRVKPVRRVQGFGDQRVRRAEGRLKRQG